MTTTPENLFLQVRQDFGGLENSPDIPDLTLLGFLNEWISQRLAKEIKLDRVTNASSSFSGTPSATPIDTDYGFALTNDINKVTAGYWKPTAGVKTKLAQTSEQELISMGKDPAVDLGAPYAFYIENGKLTGATVYSLVAKLYPIPNVAGIATIVGEGTPADCTLGVQVPFPDEFYESARYYIQHRARCFREDFSDEQKNLPLQLSNAAMVEGLRRYNYVVHNPSIRQRIKPQTGA